MLSVGLGAEDGCGSYCCEIRRFRTHPQACYIRQKKKGLDEIVKAIEQRYVITIDDGRSNGRTEDLVRARRIFSQVAGALGHRGSELAKYMRKDPSAITRQMLDTTQEGEVRVVLKGLGGNKSINQA